MFIYSHRSNMRFEEHTCTHHIMHDTQAVPIVAPKMSSGASGRHTFPLHILRWKINFYCFQLPNHHCLGIDIFGLWTSKIDQNCRMRQRPGIDYNRLIHSTTNSNAFFSLSFQTTIIVCLSNKCGLQPVLFSRSENITNKNNEHVENKERRRRPFQRKKNIAFCSLLFRPNVWKRNMFFVVHVKWKKKLMHVGADCEFVFMSQSVQEIERSLLLK